MIQPADRFRLVYRGEIRSNRRRRSDSSEGLPPIIEMED